MSSAPARSGTRASGRERLQRSNWSAHHLDRVGVVGAPVVQRGLVGPAVVGSSVVGRDLDLAQIVRRRLVRHTWSSAGWN